MNYAKGLAEIPANFEGPSEAERKWAAWQKTRPATLAHGLPNDCRLDDYGKPIRWSEHGQYTKYGWHIDHNPIPKALGGTDDLKNLRALHWQANCSHGGGQSSNLRILPNGSRAPAGR